MKNNTIPTNIKIIDLLTNVIGSRDVVQTIEPYISQAKSSIVYLDFSSVEFVSRSAAHELLLLKERLNNTFPLKEIEFTNTSNNVNLMFRIIGANRAVSNAEPKFQPKILSAKTLLDQ
ncbi:MAG: hypothetical protein NTZ18_02025 [Candidatus Komeilibacteria bacterium]|nr:hypothetical protein [Candidatus Komeilibacteria bacterium]